MLCSCVCSFGTKRCCTARPTNRCVLPSEHRGLGLLPRGPAVDTNFKNVFCALFGEEWTSLEVTM